MADRWSEQLIQTFLTPLEQRILKLLKDTEIASGRESARAMNASHSTVNNALVKLRSAGFIVSRRSGRADHWMLNTDNPVVYAWLKTQQKRYSRG